MIPIYGCSTSRGMEPDQSNEPMEGETDCVDVVSSRVDLLR